MPIDTPRLLRWQGWSGRLTGLILGALAILGHAPFHLWPVALLSLAVLFARLQWAAESQRPGRAGASVGFWWGLGFFIGSVFWMASAFVERGPEFIPLAPIMVGGLALLLAGFWALAGAGFARLRLSGLRAVLAFAALFFMAEWSRGHALGGFPWNLPGYIFEAGSRPSQMAGLINIYGLSWLVLLMSAAIGQALFWRRQLWSVGLAGIILVGLYGFGHLRLAQYEPEFVDGVTLRIVSVPFRQSEKMDPTSATDITRKFITETLRPGVEDITHVIWPEGAVNGIAVEDESLLYAVGRQLTYTDPTPPVWLMNSLEREMENGRTRYYNASVAITFDAEGVPAIATSNRKRKMVPFGENIPFMDWMDDVQLPLISTNLASVSAADSKLLSNFPGLPRVSPQICYEVVFSGLTPREREPAQFILNQSNDAWYGNTTGPAQHANIARYRSIEEGLPMVRAASNGVSAIILPTGAIYSEIKGRSVFHIDTALPKPATFNASFRHSTWGLLLLSLIIWAISATFWHKDVGSSEER